MGMPWPGTSFACSHAHEFSLLSLNFIGCSSCIIFDHVETVAYRKLEVWKSEMASIPHFDVPLLGNAKVAHIAAATSAWLPPRRQQLTVAMAKLALRYVYTVQLTLTLARTARAGQLLPGLLHWKLLVLYNLIPTCI